MTKHSFRWMAFILLAFLPACLWAAEGIGKIKELSGDVVIERSGQKLKPTLGTSLNSTDKITTGKDGVVGILFNDDSRISAGPNTSLSLDKFSFDPATQDGNLDLSVKKGTLSVISGKLVQKNPGALQVKTPAAILAVRGTEFAVKVEEPSAEGQ